ncbi:MAG TPA: DUF3800 domain-containing protein [Pirellulales bacterium]|nr:DUF3800 domain-containing protein [Pirellulales bacterium]
MPDPSEAETLIAYHFVDEAGTPTLFARRRKPIVGLEGCSNYFILGSLEVDEPQSLDQQLHELRLRLLADPYFKGVPSMQPERGRTAILLHAKDDPPEVRYEVFKLLATQSVRFRAVIRDKHQLLHEVAERNRADPAYRYSENELYDTLVSDLFKWGFHTADQIKIRFAKRGKSDRTAALTKALDHARAQYERNFGVAGHAAVEILPGRPQDSGCLQAVDYFLWALQRLYEQEEERFWGIMRSKATLVHDMDDRRKNPFGVFYIANNPLTLEARAKK